MTAVPTPSPPDASSPFDALPPRQRQVADRIMAGQTDRQIAAELGIAIQTVKNHATAVYRACGIGPSRPAQARIALSLVYVEAARKEARDQGYAVGYRHGWIDGREAGKPLGRAAVLKEIAERCSVCPVR